MVDFDPDDGNIPQKLRNRFISWASDVPRLQFSQYGPINKYLNLKFPGAMVKPQGLIRPIMSERELEGLVGEGTEGLGEDAGPVNSSFVTIDSTGTLPQNVRKLLSSTSAGQYVSNREQKRYPDFIVASYFDDGDSHDKIRMIVEIGSVHNREKVSQKLKDDTRVQLLNYMGMLGREEGVRWARTVLGVAILGTEVCFSRPRRKKDGSITFTRPMKWYDLYDGTFVKEIDKVARTCKEDDD